MGANHHYRQRYVPPCFLLGLSYASLSLISWSTQASCWDHWCMLRAIRTHAQLRNRLLAPSFSYVLWKTQLVHSCCLKRCFDPAGLVHFESDEVCQCCKLTSEACLPVVRFRVYKGRFTPASDSGAPDSLKSAALAACFHCLGSSSCFVQWRS